MKMLRLFLPVYACIVCILCIVCAGCAGYAAAVEAEPDPVFYVTAGGSDRNNGLSEATPFRSLFTAMVRAPGAKVKKIIVVGVLDMQSEQTSNEERVFALQGGGRDSVITITGKANCPEEERAVLSGEGAFRRVVQIRGETNIRFENIEISGGSSRALGGGLVIGAGAIVTLGPGTVVRNNHSVSGGGGAAVAPGGRLFVSGAVITGNSSESAGGGIACAGERFGMDSGEISNNSAPAGGGIAVFDLCLFTLEGGMIVSNQAEMFGGGIMIQNARGTMLNGAVQNNQSALSGGGIGIMNQSVFVLSGGEVRENTAGEHGGGIASDETSVISVRGGLVAGNKAVQNGGGVFSAGSFDKQTGSLITGSGENANSAAAGRAIYLYREAVKFVDDDAGSDLVMDEPLPDEPLPDDQTDF
ncbi:MAG: hypothetical protein LBJ31_00410 [Treponema sp.]|jgi:predicted outer membrane repeat protein|nr:hypothetical protein [Treponema sp.]